MENTIYVGGLLEKVSSSTGTDYRHMIRAGTSTVIVSRHTSGTNETYYTTQDSLGSTAVVTKNDGTVVVSENFGASGNRRGSNWQGSPSAQDWTGIAGTTRRGFTDHTMLDNLTLTHMNGRMYDPILGRFLSPDPFVQTLSVSQALNPYSYVWNNPASLVDPSGFRTDHCETWDDNSDSDRQSDCNQLQIELWCTATETGRGCGGTVAGSGYVPPSLMPDAQSTEVGYTSLLDAFADASGVPNSNQFMGQQPQNGGNDDEPGLTMGAVLVAAGISSQADSPIPGPGDVVAGGIIVVGGGIVLYNALTNSDASSQSTTTTRRSDVPYLVRYGPGPESAASLAADAAAAEARGFPHGVSARLVTRVSNSLLRAGRVAPLSLVQSEFPAFQTGGNPTHFTVVLPNPVTPEDAIRFNAVFTPK